MNRVAISGLGIVAPPGVGKEAFWNGVKQGKSFVSPITRFDASLYPSQIAGQVEDLDTGSLSFRLLKKMDSFSVFSLIATDHAIKDAAIDLDKEDPYNVGVFLGNALGGWLYAETELRDLYVEGRQGVSPYMASAWFPAAPQGQISILYGIKGYSKTMISDKASALMAIGYAANVVDQKKISIALAGGTEAPISPYALLCCSTEGSISHGPYRPFDKDRDGFVVSEGAGLITLESEENALKRGTDIYGFITGYSSTCDGAHRITPNPTGKELADTIRAALKMAGYKPEDIDYVCADGIATRIGDLSEARAIKEVFGSKRNIPVSAPKSMFGHMLGASGAVDVITTLLAMRNGIIPPTINHKTDDPECDLDCVPNEAREADIRKAIIISRGRGGINAVLAVERS